MASSTATRPRVKASTQPLDARLTLTIRGTSYALTAIDPGPDNSRAWRLEKLGGKREIYDVCRTNEGLVVCDCPSYVSTHEGTCSTCKHGSALVAVGLLDAPKGLTSSIPPAPAFVRLPDEFDEVEKAPALVLVGDDGTTLAEAETWHARAHAAALAVASGAAELLTSKPPVAPLDLEFYHCQDAVARGKALWLSHRDLFAKEPLPAKAPRMPGDEPAPVEGEFCPGPGRRARHGRL
jgi:hypothetical protein